MSAMVEALRSRYTPYTPTPLPISTHAPVLLVDDDESMREAVTLLLEEPGYAVTAITNVVAALGMMPPIHRDRPDHPAIMALAH